MDKRKRLNILLLGIGNILFQDEGIGVHFAHYMDEKYDFKSDIHNIDIVDGGTLAQRLIPCIIKYDKVIIIDCIDAHDSNPGDIYFFDFLSIPKLINWQGSAHEVEMLQTLNMIKMNGDLPQTSILGVIPKRVADDTTFELSMEVSNAVITMENVILNELKKHDFSIIKKDEDITIEEISKISFKREMRNGTKI